MTKNNPKEYNKHKKLCCEACGCPSDPMTPLDIDHVKSRGSGGSDHPCNLLTLCRNCHIEKHRVGLRSFVQNDEGEIINERVWLWLKANGWEYDENFNKWIAPPEARR